jgi:hypothetical protein
MLVGIDNNSSLPLLSCREITKREKKLFRSLRDEREDPWKEREDPLGNEGGLN